MWERFLWVKLQWKEFLKILVRKTKFVDEAVGEARWWSLLVKLLVKLVGEELSVKLLVKLVGEAVAEARCWSSIVKLLLKLVGENNQLILFGDVFEVRLRIRLKG